MTVVWYQVRDLAAARAFYTDVLGFGERHVDDEAGWVRLERNGTELVIAEGEPTEGGVASVDVGDVKGEAEQLREKGAEVGTVLELHAAMRIVDVFDPDGNRLQLVEELE